jgi:hypothetical protein
VLNLEEFHLGLEALILPDEISRKDLLGKVDIPVSNLVVEASRFFLELLNVSF